MINEAVRERLGRWRSADILMRSVEFQLVVDMQRADLWDKIGHHLGAAARALEAAGAVCIVVCTMPVHLVAPAIGAVVGVPFLRVIDVAAERIGAVGCRQPLLLATCYTMEQGFYLARMGATASRWRPSTQTGARSLTTSSSTCSASR